MGFSLLSILPHVVIISCLKWSHKSSFNQTKHISLCCVPPCLVTRQMFWSSSLTKHRGLFYAFLNISHLLYIFPRCKGLPKWDLSCETCFFGQIFWLVGTQFLCLAHLTFRFVIDQFNLLPLLFVRLKSENIPI